MEPTRQLYASLGRWAWVPQNFKKKMLKQIVNHWMTGLAPKLQVVYNSWKKDIPTIERETKIPFFVVICGSINFLIWIRVEVEHRGRFFENLIIHPKFLIIWTPKDAYIVLTQSLKLQRMHVNPIYSDCIAIAFQIKFPIPLHFRYHHYFIAFDICVI